MEELKQYLLLNPDSTYSQIYQKFKGEIWGYLNEQGSETEMLKQIIESVEDDFRKIQDESALLASIAEFVCSITEEETVI